MTTQEHASAAAINAALLAGEDYAEGIAGTGESSDTINARAEALGADAGRAAASWYEVSESNAAAIVKGIDDGDPAVLDTFNPPDLSGEWADSYTSRDLASDLDIDEDADDAAEALSEAEESWLAGALSAYWSAIESRARSYLPKPAYDQYADGRLCGNCGSKVPGKRTCVIDWREDWLCPACIASFDWTAGDWTYDAATDTYRRRNGA